MKVLVTGGAGFLGYHLCNELLNRGNEVICMDNLNTGLSQNINKLCMHQHHYNFQFFNHDVNNKFNLSGVGQVYNLASPAAPGDYRKDPLYTLKTNIKGMLNILSVATENFVKIMQVSTIKVLNNDLHGKDSCYIEGKRCAEVLCMKYKEKYGTDVKIARLHNVYGPQMSLNDSRVIPQFIMKGLRGEDLTVFGGGEQIDSFGYVGDVVNSLIAFMDGSEVIENIGGLELTTIFQLANTISTILPAKIIHTEGEFSPKEFVASTSKYWKPKVNLEEGLKITIEDFRVRING